MPIRNNWSMDEVKQMYNKPLLELIMEASRVHKEHYTLGEVQVSSLLSIKTGGCSEDCSYCPQSAKYHTEIEIHPLMKVADVVETAKRAQEAGSSRFCMGAAWREVRDNRDFDRILEMVTAVNDMGMEVCCTLGMLTDTQAEKLAKAGLYAYNHNLDTSENNYENIISTRTYDDRLKTLDNVRKAGITVCCGGIIGLGETEEDRISFLHRLATLPTHPESVPINALVPVKGTPLENTKRIEFYELVRMIAVARMLMPTSDVRLSAGRLEMSIAEQALCFLAGANSIFAGDKLLTTPNPDVDQDHTMFKVLGLVSRKAFQKQIN